MTLPQPHPCLIDKAERVMSVHMGGGLFNKKTKKKKITIIMLIKITLNIIVHTSAVGSDQILYTQSFCRKVIERHLQKHDIYLVYV